MLYDPTWQMPTENWQSSSSYQVPLQPPSSEPDDMPLVQLPCINEQYLPFVQGCLDQLKLPYAWDVPDDTARSLTVERMSLLRSMFAMSINNPCCVVEMRLTTDCILQFSVDGGTTWTDVTGWSANFPTCVRSDIAAPLDNPLGLSTDTMRCSVAGYLAQTIIQQSLSSLVTTYNSSGSYLQAASDLATVLAAVGFVWTAGFIDAVATIYNLITPSTVSGFTSAETDATLRNELTCCIYQHMGTDVGITNANFTAIRNCICALSYSTPEVITAICAFIDNLGVVGLQNLQVGAPLVVEDCSTCGGPNCYEWKWYASNSFTVLYGTYLTSTGYGALNCVFPSCIATCNYLELEGVLTSAVPISEIDLRVAHSAVNTNSGTIPRLITLKNGGSTVRTISLPNGAYSSSTWIRESFAPTTADTIILQWFEDFGAIGAVLDAFEIRWNGTNPLGSSPCTDLP